MEDVSSGLESIPDDEIMSISGDDEDADSDKDEVVADKLIDEIVDEADKDVSI
ncbi:hypothetical protein Tco_0373003, partial [Tanacetum coccineum]